MTRVALFSKIAFRLASMSLWSKAHVPKPTLSNPTEKGWLLQGGQRTPVFMTLGPNHALKWFYAMHD